jgi:hypothetical protein
MRNVEHSSLVRCAALPALVFIAIAVAPTNAVPLCFKAELSYFQMSAAMTAQLIQKALLGWTARLVATA